MFKVINGKKYDTKTAELKGQATSREDCNDYKYWSQTLYLKKTGEFFIHHELYYESGASIEPLTEDQAKNWVEKNMAGEKYEELFGEVAE